MSVSQQRPGDLVFGRTHRPSGFSDPALVPFDGSAEPIVRELVQNSLHAAQRVGRAARVGFTIKVVPTSTIPGWDAYWTKLDLATAERARRRTSPNHDEVTTVSRIREARNQEWIVLLSCSDNGIGLDPGRMDAVLTPGNSENGDSGLGSFGVGHHTAFSASSFRYLLYGSRYLTDSGHLHSIGSGHAILASHRDPDDQRHMAADGYYVRNGDSSLLTFDASELQYVDEVPNILIPELEQDASSDGTGTVVCIVGFNWFNNTEEDTRASVALEAIVTGVASNFTAAIADNSLSVTVSDCTSEGDRMDRPVNQATLGASLAPVAHRETAWREGHVRGADAHRAHLVLTSGATANLVCDGERVPQSDVRVRYLRRDIGDPSQTKGNTRVTFFRRGMWISSDIRGLMRGEFANQPLFDATVELHGGELERLVRAAEGPEHRGLQRSRLDSRDRSLLRKYIAAIAQCLRDAIGSLPENLDYTPTEAWAQLALQDQSFLTPERVRPRSAVAGVQRSEAVEEETEEEPGGGSEDPTPVPTPREDRPSDKPRPGVRPDYAYSLGQGTEPGELIADVFVRDDVDTKAQFGVRVITANGSDDTCEKQLPTRFLRLRDVTRAALDDGVDPAIVDETNREATLAAVQGSQTLMITLVEHHHEINTLSLDLVYRRKARRKASATASLIAEPEVMD